METPPKSEIILYQTEDKQTRLQVQLDGDTVWLSQAQMAELFQTTKQNVSLHIQNIFKEGELRREATVKESLTVQSEGDRKVSRPVDYYNLDVVISVGYRVKSLRGTHFRIWATQRLREYIVKGFALDDARLKAGKSAYFDELLARIRDIRSSEKEFWRKVLDIYATSADYDPSAEASQRFFATVQNKMHWGAHGHTAAEIIHARADSTKPNMGLTAWLGSRPRKTDALVAKNYLTVDEIEALNLIVSLYLDFAELQAKSRKLMTMWDWIAKLDDFLRLSDRQILTHAGKVSHEVAAAKAATEYEKFRVIEDAMPSAVEKDFDQAVKKLKPPSPPRAKKRKP
ncbi:MAG: virulence RhuM family protein [Verrucomicrobiota bacterium]